MTRRTLDNNNNRLDNSCWLLRYTAVHFIYFMYIHHFLWFHKTHDNDYNDFTLISFLLLSAVNVKPSLCIALINSKQVKVNDYHDIRELLVHTCCIFLVQHRLALRKVSVTTYGKGILTKILQLCCFSKNSNYNGNIIKLNEEWLIWYKNICFLSNVSDKSNLSLLI